MLWWAKPSVCLSGLLVETLYKMSIRRRADIFSFEWHQERRMKVFQFARWLFCNFFMFGVEVGTYPHAFCLWLINGIYIFCSMQTHCILLRVVLIECIIHNGFLSEIEIPHCMVVSTGHPQTCTVYTMSANSFLPMYPIHYRYVYPTII